MLISPNLYIVASNFPQTHMANHFPKYNMLFSQHMHLLEHFAIVYTFILFYFLVYIIWWDLQGRALWGDGFWHQANWQNLLCYKDVCERDTKAANINPAIWESLEDRESSYVSIAVSRKMAGGRSTAQREDISWCICSTTGRLQLP